MNEEVGRRLRTLRMLMGKSRQNLAEALGVSPGRIEDFESGSAGIGAQLLQHLSDELNVPPSFFDDTHAVLGETARPSDRRWRRDPEELNTCPPKKKHPESSVAQGR